MNYNFIVFALCLAIIGFISIKFKIKHIYQFNYINAFMFLYLILLTLSFLPNNVRPYHGLNDESNEKYMFLSFTKL